MTITPFRLRVVFSLVLIVSLMVLGLAAIHHRSAQYEYTSVGNENYHRVKVSLSNVDALKKISLKTEEGTLNALNRLILESKPIAFDFESGLWNESYMVGGDARHFASEILKPDAYENPVIPMGVEIEAIFKFNFTDSNVFIAASPSTNSFFILNKGYAAIPVVYSFEVVKVLRTVLPNPRRSAQ